MTSRMTKRERVERTLALEETDRVPLYDLLRNDAAYEHFGGEALPPLAPDDTTVRRLHEIAARAVGQFLDMTRSVGFGWVEEKEFTDEYGFVHHSYPVEKTSWIARRPFDDEQGAADFLKRWIKDVQEETAALRADARRYRE